MGIIEKYLTEDKLHIDTIKIVEFIGKIIQIKFGLKSMKFSHLIIS